MLFHCQDASNSFESGETYDLIFSSFSLQCLQNKLGFFEWANECLKHNGGIAITVPLEVCSSLELAASEIISASEWQRFFLKFSPGWYMSSFEEYKKQLTAVKYQKIVLRTNISNYPQIVSLGKLGFSKIESGLHSVFQKRNNDQILSDLRAYYLYNLNKTEKLPMPAMLSGVTIVHSSGNDTALVRDIIPRNMQVQLSQKIQSFYPGVEQVMFVEHKNGESLPRGQMAGGEFCCNALRALGYVLMNNKQGSIKVSVSGVPIAQKVVIRHQYVEAEIPIKQAFNSCKFMSEHEYLVELGESVFFITTAMTDDAEKIHSAPENQKYNAMLSVLKKLKLTDSLLVGFIILDKASDGIYLIHPYIYVKKLNTVCYETACGSATAEVGSLIASEFQEEVKRYPISQPSGGLLYVTVKKKRGKIEYVSIGGSVNVVFQGKLYFT